MQPPYKQEQSSSEAEESETQKKPLTSEQYQQQTLSSTFNNPRNSNTPNRRDSGATKAGLR